MLLFNNEKSIFEVDTFQDLNSKIKDIILTMKILFLKYLYHLS